jgi:hypothetical protein
MSKSKHRHRQTVLPQPPQAPPPGFNLFLGYDPKGKMEPVDVAVSKEGWSEYSLADGSQIRAKALLIDVKHAVGQHNVDGEPIYVMNFTVITQVKAPETLKKKG